MIAAALKKVSAGRTPREKRLLLYLLLLLSLAAWKLTPRYWKPSIVLDTEHYSIQSTATQWQTEEVARAVEILYTVYTERFKALEPRPHHPKLKMRLYRDREEFQRINPGVGWAEAFYREPYCHAYFPVEEANPCHWMLHEAVHQLNNELLDLRLKKWLSEGVAEYFSVSRIKDGKFHLGTIDKEAYPVWWIDEIAQEQELVKNLENGSVIPLRSIITGWGGPRMRSHVNLYYLHWWTFTHFLFESAAKDDAALALLKTGGNLASVEKHFGSLPDLEHNWHAHVRKIKAAVQGNDLEFHRTGKLPPN